MGNHFVTKPEDKLPGELYNVKNGISNVRKFIDDQKLKITKDIEEMRHVMALSGSSRNKRMVRTTPKTLSNLTTKILVINHSPQG